MAISMDKLSAEQLQAMSRQTLINPQSNNGIVGVTQTSNGFTIIQDSGDVYSFSTSTNTLQYAGNAKTDEAEGENEEEKAGNKDTVDGAKGKISKETESLEGEKDDVASSIKSTSKTFEALQDTIEKEIEECLKNAQKHTNLFESTVKSSITENTEAFKNANGEITKEQYSEKVLGTINTEKTSYDGKMASIFQKSTDIDSKFGQLSGLIGTYATLQSKGKDIETSIEKRNNITKPEENKENKFSFSFLTFANIKEAAKTDKTSSNIDLSSEKTAEINEAKEEYRNKWATLKQMPIDADQNITDAKKTGQSEIDKMQLQFEKEKAAA